MDIDINMIKGKSALTNRASLKSSSISLNTLFILYHQYIKLNNDLSDIESQKPIDSFQLSYAREAEIRDFVRPATDKDSASNSQCVYNKTPVFKRKPQSHGKSKGKSIDRPSSNPSENIVNTQLSYDINQTMELDTWNGNFHSISLHSSIKYFISNAKNIKESLHHMMKYILNKKVENGKVNNINDFKGIDKATQRFISLLYKSDLLLTVIITPSDAK